MRTLDDEHPGDFEPGRGEDGTASYVGAEGWNPIAALRALGWLCYASTREGDLFRHHQRPNVRVVVTGRRAYVEAKLRGFARVQWTAVVPGAPATNPDLLARHLAAASLQLTEDARE